MAMLAGCATGTPVRPMGSPDPPSSVASPSLDSSRPGTVTAVEGDHPPEWIRAKEWRPKEPVRDLRQFTEEEKLQLWPEHVAELTARYRLTEPPEVALEQWIRVDETGPVLGKCLSEFGYHMTYDPFPGISGGPATQNGGDFAQTYERDAWYVCLARFAIDPTYTQPPTRDQARVQYEYLTEIWLPCMRGHGQELVDLPDLETFVENFVTQGGWSPWSEVRYDYEVAERCGGSSPAPAAYYGT